MPKIKLKYTMGRDFPHRPHKDKYGLSQCAHYKQQIKPKSMANLKERDEIKRQQQQRRKQKERCQHVQTNV